MRLETSHPNHLRPATELRSRKGNSTIPSDTVTAKTVDFRVLPPFPEDPLDDPEEDIFILQSQYDLPYSVDDNALVRAWTMRRVLSTDWPVDCPWCNNGHAPTHICDSELILKGYIQRSDPALSSSMNGVMRGGASRICSSSSTSKSNSATIYPHPDGTFHPYPPPLAIYDTDHVVASQLNGVNGEWTCKDDVKKGAGKRVNRRLRKGMQRIMPFAGKMAGAAALGLASGVGKAAARQALPGLAALAFGGMGDYVRKGSRRNTAGGTHKYGSKFKGERSTFPLSAGSVVLQHSEYVGDLVSGTSAGFVSQNYPINPGQAGTFAWASAMASQYAEYVIDQLVVEFRPNVSKAMSTTTGSVQTMGNVLMSYQSNATAAPFSNKQTMEASDAAVVGAPYDHLYLAVECKRNQNPTNVLFVRTGNPPAGADLRLYDMGFFQVVNTNVPTNSASISLGEIHVHYRFRFMKPQITNMQSNVISSHYYSNALTAAGNVFPAMTAVTSNFQNLTFGNNTVSLPLNLEYGNFILVLKWSGYTAWTLTAPAVSIANGNFVNVIANGTLSSYMAPPGATVTASAIMVVYFAVNAPGSALCALTFSGFVGPTAGTVSMEAFLTPWNTTVF